MFCKYWQWSTEGNIAPLTVCNVTAVKSIFVKCLLHLQPSWLLGRNNAVNWAHMCIVVIMEVNRGAQHMQYDWDSSPVLTLQKGKTHWTVCGLVSITSKTRQLCALAKIWMWSLRCKKTTAWQCKEHIFERHHCINDSDHFDLATTATPTTTNCRLHPWLSCYQSVDVVACYLCNVCVIF